MVAPFASPPGSRASSEKLTRLRSTEGSSRSAPVVKVFRTTTSGRLTARGGDDADIGDAILGGCDDGRHVTHVSDVLLAGEHGIDDDAALQPNLEFNG